MKTSVAIRTAATAEATQSGTNKKKTVGVGGVQRRIRI